MGTAGPSLVHVKVHVSGVITGRVENIWTSCVRDFGNAQAWFNPPAERIPEQKTFTRLLVSARIICRTPQKGRRAAGHTCLPLDLALLSRHSQEEYGASGQARRALQNEQDDGITPLLGVYQ